MSTLKAFSPPADQQDLAGDPSLQSQLDQHWNTNVDGFTQQAIVGNPWSSTNASDQTAYYNPLDVDIPDGTAAVPVTWSPFPNRLSQYCGQNASPPNPYNYSIDQLEELADTGFVTVDGATEPLPEIPTVLCPQADWSKPTHPYGPYGPRGWQDEYCEWSVTRNGEGKITRVDFTCENPEYWYTLWAVSPETVAALYEQTLNAGTPADAQITVTVEDLQLVDPATGDPVIDPSTGRPAYNPLNRWNLGPVSTRTAGVGDSGGAMHLTSTPNTLQTELGLAGAATVQRTLGNTDPQQLICCAQYGQEYRHSDPHIGQGTNQLVGQGNIVSLADPVGLYIQTPSFTRYQLPSDPNLPPGAEPSDCWQVMRGAEILIDPVTAQPYPGNFILHAAFQLPESWIQAGVSFTVGDITIGGRLVQWGSQIVETFQIGLFPRPILAKPPPPLACVGVPAEVLVQPLQMFYGTLWDAYYGTTIKNPVGVVMNLASNTVIISPLVEQGAEGVELVLTCSGVAVGPQGQMPTITFPPSDDITVTAVEGPETVTYAVPGNSYPSDNQLLRLTVDIDATAELGLRGIQVTNYGQNAGPPAPAFLNVVPAGSLASSGSA
jgi:hypothetical protein